MVRYGTISPDHSVSAVLWYLHGCVTKAFSGCMTSEHLSKRNIHRRGRLRRKSMFKMTETKKKEKRCYMHPQGMFGFTGPVNLSHIIQTVL